MPAISLIKITKKQKQVAKQKQFLEYLIDLKSYR
jgi:hypothetical protein